VEEEAKEWEGERLWKRRRFNIHHSPKSKSKMAMPFQKTIWEFFENEIKLCAFSLFEDLSIHFTIDLNVNRMR
jgi:hypothetical protein